MQAGPPALFPRRPSCTLPAGGFASPVSRPLWRVAHRARVVAYLGHGMNLGQGT